MSFSLISKYHIYLPTFRFIFKAGYTWESLNSYEYPAVAILLRYSHVTQGVSTVLNPIIYFYVYKDLRVGFLRLFSKVSTFSWEQDRMTYSS